MTTAAWTPRPETSPTTKTKPPSGQEMTSNQSPPISITSRPATYRVAISTPAISVQEARQEGVLQ